MQYMGFPARAWVVLVMSVSGVLVQGCSSEKKAPPQAASKAVSTLTVTTETIEPSYELAGRTVASEISQVRPQVGGIVTQQLFKEGTQVSANQPLYQIDASLYQASVDEAAGNLALAKATLSATRRQAERYAELAKVQGVSQQELDNAQAAYAQGKANIAAKEAGLATARTNLRFTQITAPISGRIGRSSITRGALVSADQITALATIQKLDPIFVDLTQSSEDYMALRKELASHGIEPSSLTVHLQSKDGSRYPQAGKVTFSDIAVDERTGNVMLRASFPNPDYALLPGLYVRAQLLAGPRSGVILLPQGVVVRNTKGDPLVWMIGADGKAEQRLVTLGAAIGNRWQIAKGISPGERVITDSLQSLRVGMAVNAIKAQSPS